MAENESIEYYDNGQIKSKNYIDDEGNDVDKTWHENGQMESMNIGNYDDFFMPFFSQEWYPNGQLAELRDNRDKKNIINSWYEDGSKAGECFNDENGMFVEKGWHQNGKKGIERYTNRETEAVAEKEWHPNGQIKLKSKTVKINYEYEYISRYFWHEDGSKKSELFIDENNHKNFQSWHSNGKKSKESYTDKNGVRITKEWDDTGKKLPPPPFSVSDTDPSIMDGLTDDEKLLGYSFWKQTL